MVRSHVSYLLDESASEKWGPRSDSNRRSRLRSAASCALNDRDKIWCPMRDLHSHPIKDQFLRLARLLFHQSGTEIRAVLGQRAPPTRLGSMPFRLTERLAPYQSTRPRHGSYPEMFISLLQHRCCRPICSTLARYSGVCSTREEPIQPRRAYGFVPRRDIKMAGAAGFEPAVS